MYPVRRGVLMSQLCARHPSSFANTLENG